MKEKYILGVDFDDTISYRTKDFIPKKLLPNAKEVINWAYDNDIYIIIWTCRDGKMIDSMVKFLKENGIKYHLINDNVPWLDFETSRKIYFDFCVDDKCCYGEIDWLKIKEVIKIKKMAKEITQTN